MSLKKNGEYKECHDNGKLSMHSLYKDDKEMESLRHGIVMVDYPCTLFIRMMKET